MKLDLSGPDARVALPGSVQLPLLGLGVFRIEDEAELTQVVAAALEAGYRLFDTAKYYENEAALGNALRIAGARREDIFVTTKVWIDDMKARRIRAAVREALERFGFEYLDMVLIHWPVDGLEEAWLDLEALHAEGLVRAIGVSNCLPEHLKRIEAVATVAPMVNQIEFHPWKAQPQLRQYCEARGILPQAYGPFMQGQLLNEPTITEIARRHGKSTAQVILRWDLQHGVPTLPKSASAVRARQNMDIFDFALSAKDMALLDKLDRNTGSHPDPHEVH